jgi:hypothetical protein
VNVWRDRFAAVPFPDKSGTWQMRFYQEIAVNRVLEKIGGNAKRILLTLATGTGKTSIAFQIAWKLFQTRWNLGGEPVRRPRILFLIISTHFNTKQQVFLDFVLSQYVKVGVDELAQEKLSPLLKLKYHDAIADAVADLGRPDEIGKVFAGFQKYLYQGQPAAA